MTRMTALSARFRTLHLALLLSGVSTAAGAADLAADAPTMPRFALAQADTWIVTVSGNGVAQPRFPGARDYTAFGFPSVDFRKAGEPVRFSAPDDGVSFTVFESPVFRFGPVARFQSGRYLSDDRRRLFGLNKINWAVEPGAFFEFWPTQFLRTRVELRRGVNGHHGFVGSIGADYVLPVGQFVFSLGPRFQYGDEAFNSKYFSVSPLEAALNGQVTPYSAGGGFNTVGVLAAATYTLDERWAVTGYGGYNRLVGDSGRSPIVRRLGTPDQFTFGAKVSYSFSMPALF
jgi:MipA family protein